MSDVQKEGKNGLDVSSKEEDLKSHEQVTLEEPLTTVRDIEEGRDAYKPSGFHPVYIGDVYSERYEVVRKIGYGQYSTVWLVKDTQQDASEHQYKALKVLRADCYDGKDPVLREILTHLREADRTHPGYSFICHLRDDFEHKGPYGSHVCLVFDLIGETLRTFRPTSHGLDYAHDSGIIHTDIQPDNIFVRFRDRSLIAKFLNEVPAPQQDKSAKSYTPLRSQPLRKFYFFPSDQTMNFELCLGDWGVSSWSTKHLCEVIQPIVLRSPEVLIEAPWDWTTDWWNLGTVILEVFRGVQMSTGQDSQYSPYMLKNHLEEIVACFGPFPKSLLDQGALDIAHNMFNEDGTVKDSDPSNRPGLVSYVDMDDLSLEIQEDFVSFLYAIMKIDPKERLSTMDLLRHPWIEGRK